MDGIIYGISGTLFIALAVLVSHLIIKNIEKLFKREGWKETFNKIENILIHSFVFIFLGTIWFIPMFLVTKDSSGGIEPSGIYTSLILVVPFLIILYWKHINIKFGYTKKGREDMEKLKQQKEDEVRKLIKHKEKTKAIKAEREKAMQERKIQKAQNKQARRDSILINLYSTIKIALPIIFWGLIFIGSFMIHPLLGAIFVVYVLMSILR